MHNIQYFEFEENVDRAKAEKGINDFVKEETYREGGHGLDSKIRWLDSLETYESYEDAQAAIKRNDKGWYDQLAVKYYFSSVVQTKALKGLRDKAAKALDDKHSISLKLWATTVKSEFVTCRCCGSKLRRKYIRTNQCPVCAEDMRPETMRKQVAAATARFEKANRAVKDYISKHSKKTVRWLVKIEYHT